MDDLGEHHYLGDNSEGNGLIYTHHGGFIDIGHVRDVADWTAYLYSLIIFSRDKGEFMKQLGYEGGNKILKLYVDKDLDSMDCQLLAGKIAYDLSLWHELSTWFGASAVPMLPERYSSFSVEDVYSNLLGVLIGMEALKSDLPYNEAMTKLLIFSLDSLGSVKTEEETYAALEAVRDIWWTRDKRLPNRKVLLERDTEVYTSCRPWIIRDSIIGTPDPQILYVPKTTLDGQILTSYYQLSIDLNYKFPVKKIFPERETRLITQDDFGMLLNRVEYDPKNQYHTSYSNTDTQLSETDKNRL